MSFYLRAFLRRNAVFVQNSNNKTHLIQLIGEVLVQSREKVWNILKADKLYYSVDGICQLISCQGIEMVGDLSSNQEEADTKVVYCASHALNAQPDKTVIVRNYTGNVDITIIMLSLIIDHSERVIPDSNKGKE